MSGPVLTTAAPLVPATDLGHLSCVALADVPIFTQHSLRPPVWWPPGMQGCLVYFPLYSEEAPNEAFTCGLWSGTNQHFMFHWMSHCGTCILDLSHFPNCQGKVLRVEKHQHLLLRVTEAVQRHMSSSSTSRSKEQIWRRVGPVSPGSCETLRILCAVFFPHSVPNLKFLEKSPHAVLWFKGSE